MTHRFFLFGASVLLAVALYGCGDGSTPKAGSGKKQMTVLTSSDGDWKAPAFKKVIWQDEFNGDAIDTSVWRYETEATGWSKDWNKELQDYVDAGAGGENARIGKDGGDSCLIITATNPAPGKYASARLTTKGNRFWKNGVTVAARIKLPRGQGIWPAFWMLPEIGDWPDAGEIDIVETIGGNGRESTAHASLHGPGYFGANVIKGSAFLPKGDFAEAYHVYEVRWAKGKIEWFIDGNLIHSVSANTVPGAWPFDDKDFYLLLNLAVGGYWPGNPDGTTAFPQSLYVDWVRVYK